MNLYACREVREVSTSIVGVCHCCGKAVREGGQALRTLKTRESAYSGRQTGVVLGAGSLYLGSDSGSASHYGKVLVCLACAEKVDAGREYAKKYNLLVANHLFGLAVFGGFLAYLAYLAYRDNGETACGLLLLATLVVAGLTAWSFTRAVKRLRDFIYPRPR